MDKLWTSDFMYTIYVNLKSINSDNSLAGLRLVRKVGSCRGNCQMPNYERFLNRFWTQSELYERDMDKVLPGYEQIMNGVSLC